MCSLLCLYLLPLGQWAHRQNTEKNSPQHRIYREPCLQLQFASILNEEHFCYRSMDEFVGLVGDNCTVKQKGFINILGGGFIACAHHTFNIDITVEQNSRGE